MSGIEVEVEARKILNEIAAEAKLSSVSGPRVEKKVLSGGNGGGDDWITDLLGSYGHGNSSSSRGGNRYSSSNNNNNNNNRPSGGTYGGDDSSSSSGSERSDGFDGRGVITGGGFSSSSGDDARSINSMHSDSINEISDEKLNAMLYGSRRVASPKASSPLRGGHSSNSIINNASQHDSFDVSEMESKNKEIARLQKLLEERSESFKDIIISEDYIQELRSKQRTTLTFHEMACISVFDNTKEFRRLLAASNAMLVETKSALQATNERCDILNSEKNNIMKSNKGQLTMLEKENSDMRERIIALEMKVTFERGARQENEDKANKYDSAITENKRQTNDIKSLQATLETLQREDRDNRMKLHDLEQKNLALVQDKMYFSNENREYKVKLDEAVKQLDDLKIRSHSLEMKNLQLSDQVIEVQSKSKSDFDSKLQKELDRIRDESNKEVENIKFASKELSEKECRILRDDKITKDMECQALRKRLDQETQELVQLQRELATQQSQSVTEMSQLKAELKIKCFEYNSLGGKLEEHMTKYRQLELDHSELIEENNMRKAALLKFENDSTFRENSLRQKLEDCQGHLRMYESLENDVDDAVIRSAGGGGGGGKGANSAESDISTIHNYTGLSNNPQRRIQQSMHLAQKLLESRKNYDALVEKKISLQQDMEILKRENQVLRGNTHLNSQPTNFLIMKLREEETKALELNGIIDDLERQLSAAKADFSTCQQDNVNLRGKLKVLLSHRSEVKELRRVIERLHDNDDDDEYSVEEEEEEMGEERGFVDDDCDEGQVGVSINNNGSLLVEN